MIKSIEEILGQVTLSWSEDDIQLLKEWAFEIIEECSRSFECTLETDGVPGSESEYPVLNRQSILDVKNKIV